MRPIWPAPSSSTGRVRSYSRAWSLANEQLLRLTWTLTTGEDYTHWQAQERKTLQRINQQIRDCLRDPFAGIGKPEPLKENRSGFWSRRIDDSHRLIYCVDAGNLVVIACRYHYRQAKQNSSCRRPP